jgi:hypothetical protein
MTLTACLRALLQRRGGSIAAPPSLGPDEAHAILSPGWNGPTMETSANFHGRGLNTYRKPTA